MEPGTLCVMTTMTVMQLQLFVTSCSVQRHSYVSRVLSFDIMLTTIHSASAYYGGARFGQGAGYGILKVSSCSGSEGRLVDCTLNKNGYYESCGHNEDIGVRCYS